jgi:hypothetical protein
MSLMMQDLVSIFALAQRGFSLIFGGSKVSNLRICSNGSDSAGYAPRTLWSL